MFFLCLNGKFWKGKIFEKSLREVVKRRGKHCLVLLLLGSMSPTYLRTAFMPIARKSVRIQSSCQYLFTLLGSTGAKTTSRTLMKLTPGVNVINILRAAFVPIFLCQKNTKPNCN